MMVLKNHKSMMTAALGSEYLRQIKMPISNESIVASAIAVYTGDTALSKEGWIDSIKGKIHSSYLKYSNEKYFKDIKDNDYFKYWKTGKYKGILDIFVKLNDEQKKDYEQTLQIALDNTKNKFFIFDKNGKMIDFNELVKDVSLFSASLLDTLNQLIDNIEKTEFDAITDKAAFIKDSSKVANLKYHSKYFELDTSKDRILFDYLKHDKSGSLSMNVINQWFKDIKINYSKFEGMIGNLEKALAKIYSKMDNLTSEKKSIVSEYLSVVLSVIRTSIGFIIFHIQTFTMIVLNNFLVSSSNEDIGRRESDGFTQGLRFDQIILKGIREVIKFLSIVFIAYIKYSILAWLVVMITAGPSAFISAVIVYGGCLYEVYKEYCKEENGGSYL